jgi:electron transfer flavoprotein beta subunit
MKNVVVLLKQTLHSEERIAIENNKVIEDGAEFVINPYDEYALEEAVKIKEEHGAEVTVISLGPPRTESALRTALAIGADKTIHINSDTFDFELDEYSASVILASVVKRQAFDLVLCGNMAIDGGSAQVAPRVAELLNLPCITAITKLQLQDQTVYVERDMEGDTERIETMMPIVLTAQQGLNDPRYPSLPGIMKAKKKPLENLSASDVGIDRDSLQAKTHAAELFLPAKREAGRIITGSTDEQVQELIRVLRHDAKVI